MLMIVNANSNVNYKSYISSIAWYIEFDMPWLGVLKGVLHKFDQNLAEAYLIPAGNTDEFAVVFGSDFYAFFSRDKWDDIDYLANESLNTKSAKLRLELVNNQVKKILKTFYRLCKLHTISLYSFYLLITVIWHNFWQSKLH